MNFKSHKLIIYIGAAFIFVMPVANAFDLRGLVDAIKKSAKQNETPRQEANSIEPTGQVKLGESTPTSGAAKSDERTIKEGGKVVEVSGVGDTLQSAKEDAIRQAVESVVNSYVASDLVMKNEAVIKDKVINYSAGFIEKMDVLSQNKRPDGLFEVKIRAVVTTQKLRRKLEEQNIRTRELESDSMFGEAVSQLNSVNSASDLWGNLLKKYPSAALEAKVVGKPKIGAEEPGEMVYVHIPFTINWDKDFLSEFISMLEKFSNGKELHSNKNFDSDVYMSGDVECFGVIVDQTCYLIREKSILDAISVQMYKNILPFKLVIQIKDGSGKVRKVLQSCFGSSSIDEERKKPSRQEDQLANWHGPFATGSFRNGPFVSSGRDGGYFVGTYRFYVTQKQSQYPNASYAKLLNSNGGVSAMLGTKVKKADLLEFKSVEVHVERDQQRCYSAL